MRASAKRSRNKLTHRSAAVAWATTILITLMALASPSAAAEVPFSDFTDVETGLGSMRGLTFADIDSDGDVDILVTDGDSQEVIWWENTIGDGSAWSRHDLDPMFNAPRDIAVGDLDGDGDLDAVAAAFDDDEVRWYENDLATGTVCGNDFCQATVGAGNGANQLSLADVDQDGDLDIVATLRAGGDLIWFENALSDASSWTKQTIVNGLDGAEDVAVADLDGDGDPDVLASNNNGAGGFSWFENNLDGSGSCMTSWCDQSLDTGGSTGVAIADVDGDGDPDLVRSSSSNVTAWWENVAGDASSWTEHPIAMAPESNSEISAADIDSDGDIDLLPASDSPVWLENTAGDGSSWTARALTGAPRLFEMNAADLDGDGDLDLIGASTRDDRLGWFENQTLHRSATFESGRTVFVGDDGDADGIVAVDLDQDGDRDLLATAGLTDSVVWFENDGTPDDGGWTEHTIAAGGNPYFAVHGDIDGDGDLDVLASVFSADTVTWFENDGDPAAGTWTAHDIVTAFDTPLTVQLADIDGDGDLDALAVTRSGDAVVWFENDGAPTTVPWTRRDVVTGFDRPIDVAAVDLDADGDLDVLSQAANSDTVAWFENDGTPDDGGWTRHDIDTALVGVEDVTPGDLDGDGDLDVLTAASTPNEVAWFENDGTPADGGWIKQVIATSITTPSINSLADVDRDGDLDFIGTEDTDSGEVRWWENDGTPNDGGWIEHVVATGLDSPDFAGFGDLDGDGDLDAFVAVEGPGDILWYRNVGGQFALPTADAVATSTPNEGETDVALLRVDGAHRGRVGDGDAELATLELLFEAASDDPLAGAELDALVDMLRLYLDDGDGAFDATLDAMFFSVAPPFTLTGGVLTLTMVDEDPNVQLAVGNGVTWWLTADLDVASGTAVPDTFQVTHVTSASSTAEMTETDLLLVLEGQDDVASSVLTINGAPTVVTEIDDATVAVGAAVNLDVAASFDDPEGDTLSFMASGLPGSLTISTDGVITGTPTTGDIAGSPYTVTVMASDPLGVAADDTFTLVVSPDLFADGFESGDTSAWTTSVP